MTEDFLHYVWRTHNFNFKNLRTTDGLAVEILAFGQWNTGAGPDFLMGRIILDGTEWVGNIEMHVCATEWNKHGHSQDPAYESVVLHVVLEEDGPVYVGARRLPCVEIRDRIEPRLVGRYLRLMGTASWVPCAPHLNAVPGLVSAVWLDRMLAARIQGKTRSIGTMISETNGNWEEVLYRNLAIAYGFKVNAAPFERLARLIPLKLIFKLQNSSKQLEALFFGCAGLLNRVFIDDYPVHLQKEFVHLSATYGLTAIGARAWVWGALRPANFPTVRIAQFATLMARFRGLFRAIIDSPNVDTLRSLFMTSAHTYWNTHSDFDRPSRPVARSMGHQSVNGILINTVVPFLFHYGTMRCDEQRVERAIDLVCALPPEKNTLTKRWEALHMQNHHAGHSQALIHLKKEFCDHRRCVACAIGNHILNSTHPADA